VGSGLLGRVVNAQGEPLDRMGPLKDVRSEPLARRPINAMERDPVRLPLDTGVRAINSMLTVAAASGSACSPARAWVNRCCWG